MKQDKVIIDYDIRGWAKDNESKIAKKYNKLIIVGEAKALSSKSSDKKIGAYAYRYNCDVLTADNTAYVEFFKNKSIKSANIVQFDLWERGNRPIYLVRMLK
jgi:hypothetical protein